jgi:hypothetical protein
MATGATLTTRALRGDEARDRMRDGGATWKHRGSAGPRREVAATSGAPAETACLQRICHSRQQSAAPRALMVRKGSPVRVRQRASETALERGVLFIGVALVTTSRRKEGVAGSSPAEALPHRAAVARRLRARSVRIVGSSLSRVPSGHRPIRGRPILPSGSRRRQRRTPRTAARRRPSSTELGPDLSRERDGSAQADPSVWRRAARRYKSCLPRLSERPAFAGLLRSSTDSRRRRRRRRGVRGARPHRAI